MENVYIAKDLGCAFRLEGKELEFAPLMQDGSYDFENGGGFVDEDLVGQEVVKFEGKEQTLSEVYRQVEKVLQ